MRKNLLTLIAFTTLCTMNVWGADEYDWDNVSKTLTINKAGEYANGDMRNYASDDKPTWNASYATTADTIIISDGFTHIGAYAFDGFNRVKTIIIPASLTSVGEKAFNACTAAVRVKFGGSPNEWASIDFQGTAARTSQPLAASTASNRYIWFYHGYSTTYTNNLVFVPGITTIKKYAFANINSISSISIPNSVTSLGNYAFYNVAPSEIAINNSTPPSLGTSVFNTSNSLSSVTLYIPTNSKSTYQATNIWKTAGTITQQAVSGSCTMSSGSASWVLNTDGTFTITGHGVISNYSSGSYGWQNFRRLVHKVVIQNDAYGDITSLGTALKWNWAVTEVTINQATIPTANILGGNSVSFANLFNTRDNVTFNIKAASLTDASVTNLGADPWNNERLDIALSDNLVIGDNADYTTLLANCSTYVEKPITLQLNRTLTNAQYNTFCSPINLTAAQLNDADIRALESSSLDGNELTLNFSSSSLSAIEAGKPYLIQPSSAVSNPTFTDIDPSSLVSDTRDTETDYVDFKGVLAPTELEGGNEDILFLGADNELLWPAVGSENKIKGMRAYFELKDAARNAVKARITMNPNHTTDIEDVQNDKVQSTKVLRNGQIYLMYEGQMYDVHGRRIQ